MNSVSVHLRLIQIFTIPKLKQTIFYVNKMQPCFSSHKAQQLQPNLVNFDFEHCKFSRIISLVINFATVGSIKTQFTSKEITKALACLFCMFTRYTTNLPTEHSTNAINLVNSSREYSTRGPHRYRDPDM